MGNNKNVPGGEMGSFQDPEVTVWTMSHTVILIRPHGWLPTKYWRNFYGNTPVLSGAMCIMSDDADKSSALRHHASVGP